MKRNLFFLFVIVALVWSCSTDQNNTDEANPESAIVGSWRAIEFQSADPNNSNVNLGAEILDELTAEECYILTFTFNQDLSVIGESSVNFLEINATPTGLEVPCPTEKDIETSTYTFDGSVLTIVDQNGMSQMIKVAIDGNTMSADAADLDIPNFDAAGEIIFEKF